MRSLPRSAVVVLALAVSLGPTDSARGEDAPPAPRAFVEVTTPRSVWYVNEAISVTLRVGYDERYLRRHGVALFLRELDVPLHVSAPWLRELEGTTPLDGGPAAGQRTHVEIAVNDDVTRAARGEDVTIEGRIFTVLEIVRRYLPSEPGELRVPAPTLRYAYAERFEEDFLGGRMPVDRRDVRVDGEALVLTVETPPEEGRPSTFAGAVGRFRVTASASETDAEDGRILLTLLVAGEGNLDVFETPRLDVLQGLFHVFGALDDHARRSAEVPGRERVRRIVYEIAPLRDDVREIRRIPFAYFDPGPPPRYEMVSTEALPILASGARGEPATSGPPRTERAPESPVPRRVRGWLVAVVVPIAVALVLLALLHRRRARRTGTTRGEADPDAEPHGIAPAVRAGEAERRLRGLLDRADASGADLADAFAEILAAWLETTPAAIIGPALAGRLVAAGADDELASRAATSMETLVSARYGRSLEPEEMQELCRSLPELVEALRRALGPGMGAV